MKSQDTVTKYGIEFQVEYTWETEIESYESVYGEPPPEGYEYWWVEVTVSHGGFMGSHSCGMIDIPGRGDPNPRINEVNAEFLDEAIADFLYNVKSITDGHGIIRAANEYRDACNLIQVIGDNT